MPGINIDKSLQAGVLADLKETWRQSYPVFKKQQEILFYNLKKTTIRNATFPFKESVPFPEYWPYGKERTTKGFKDRQIQLGLYNYSLNLSWSGFDEEDDQLGDMRVHAQMSVKRYAQLPDKMWTEYPNGVASLNPSILNAYDGAALFATTDGNGAARFGVTGGNIVTGSGVSNSGVFHDFFQVQQRAANALDPAGQLIFSPEDYDLKNLFVIGPTSYNEIFAKAAESDMMKISSDNTVSETNIIKGKFEWTLNPYLTDTSDWYVVVKHMYWKPFAYRAPSTVESITADMSNSDWARLINEKTIYTHVRTSMGPWAPFCIYKVNN